MIKINQGLMNDLTNVINRHSAENGSDTPDYIIAGYLYQCLMNFNEVMQEREKWHGRRIGIWAAFEPTASPDPTAPTCERCGAVVHDPCLNAAEQTKCLLPDASFPNGRR